MNADWDDSGDLVRARRTRVRDLVVSHRGCAVGVFDSARNLTRPESVLGALGIDLAGCAVLEGGALVEFLAASDAGLVTEIASDTRRHGVASKAVKLRDGSRAELHLIELDDTGAVTVVVFVPADGATVATSRPTLSDDATPRVAVIRVDGFGAVTAASATSGSLLGWRPEELVGTAIVNLLHPDDQDAGIANWVAAKEQRGDAVRWRTRVVRADRSPLWVEVTLTNNIDGDGRGDVVVELHDISREVAATEALAHERSLLSLLTETLPVGVAKFDRGGRIEHCNRRLVDLLAPDDAFDVIARAAGPGDAGDHPVRPILAAMFDHGVPGSIVAEHDRGGGELLHLEWTVRPVISAVGEISGGVVCVADVTEAVTLRAALERRATTDALTGCLNRAGTMTAIEERLAARDGGGVGLLFVDLNGFKRVNDVHGHGTGDVVLEIVARRLLGAVRGCDLVGRLGGDEFVVVAPGLESEASALSFAERVSDKLQGPATIGGSSLPITASMGVAWATEASASDLLAAADAAMYTAKQRASTRPVLAGTLDDPDGPGCLTASGHHSG